MSGVIQREVVEADAGQRLDRWFNAHYPQLSHGGLEKLLRKGQIRVDGGRVKASRRLEAGESIRIPPDVPTGDRPDRKKRNTTVSPQDTDFIRDLVVYEDDTLLALNKPSGIAVQGGTNTTRHIDGMLSAFGRDENKPRLVHRLDRDTSGLLVLAKTRRAAAALGFAFQKHEVIKEYWALVLGAPNPVEGTIDMPIAKKMVRIKDEEQERVIAADDDESKKAITDFITVDDAAGKAAFVALRPLTGRTHQIRVHCAAIGTPVIGDRKYGGTQAIMEGVAPSLHLHCRAMAFRHPKTSKQIVLSAPIGGYMQKTWTFFGFNQYAEVTWPQETPRKTTR